MVRSPLARKQERGRGEGGDWERPSPPDLPLPLDRRGEKMIAVCVRSSFARLGVCWCRARVLFTPRP
jgi:hypothetical protein